MKLTATRPDELAAELSGGSVDLEHTDMSSFSVTSGYDEAFETAADVFSPARFRANGETLMRGVLTRAESTASRGETRLEGRGRAWYLSRTENSVRYENEFVHDAIRDYWERTQFDAEVFEPSQEIVAENVFLQDAPGEDSFEDILDGLIDDTDPFEIVGDEVHVLPSNSVDFQGSGTGAASLDYVNEFARSTGEAESTGRSTFEVNLEYDIKNPVLRYRVDGGDGEHSPYDIDLNGEVIDGMGESGLQPGINWTTASIPADTLSAGSYEIGFQNAHDPEFHEETDAAFVDGVSLRDGRFSYNDDNTLDENGQLSGPELFPSGDEASTLVFETAEAVRAIVTARLTVEETENQSLPLVGISFDDGDSWFDETNAFTVEADSNIPTNTVVGRVRFGRYGTRTDETPTEGFKGHRITFYQIGADTESRGVIEGQTFTADDLTNLKNLHEQGNMRFVVDHLAEGLEATSFPVGRPPPESVEWKATDHTRDLDLNDYANEVVLRGASKPEDERDGPTDLRYEAKARNESEIARLMALGLTEDEATITITLVDPRLENQTAVNQLVAARLQEAVQEREMKGTLDIQPTLVPPGYRYEVEQFGGASLDLQTVSFEVGRGVLQFRDDETVVPNILTLSADVNSVKEAL